MWKDYSVNFVRKNRASSISIMVSAFIATLFLSLICSLSYNFWTYEVEKIILEEGDWQGRITGKIGEEELEFIQNFANVRTAVVNEELSQPHETVVDICFHNARTIYQDMPLLVDRLSLERDAAAYHELLLSRYMIHDPEDTDPPLLMAFYLIILLIVSLSLVLIIRNSFAVSMNARVHQFGIFSSIGATPGQICTCLLQEAAALCVFPILLGSLMGIAFSFGALRMLNLLAADEAGRHDAVFRHHPLVFVITVLVSALTVLVSAWLPARRMSKLTPLEAIRNENELELKRKRHSRILFLLFGVEGELAGNALRARKKALRTSALSLTLSFLGFTIMLCFFTLSGISTEHTYFEKYQGTWDVMATVEDTDIENFKYTGELQNLEGVKSCAVYQKAEAVTRIGADDISEEVNRLGGLGELSDLVEIDGEGSYLVEAPIIVLDDVSFAEYCDQIGMTSDGDGVVILNCIWDSVNSNFRYREYIPYIKEVQTMITLRNIGQNEVIAEIPVLAYTQEAPVLREEYDDYALVQFIPLSVWNRISGQIGNTESDTYIRIMGEEGLTAVELDQLEADISKIAGREYHITCENRIREKTSNDKMIKGFMLILGGFCSLLALIGIANIFSNTLGFLDQRRQELAQYMSVGMTPGEIRKIFCIEALVIAGRPLLITVPLTVLAVGLMIRASYLDPKEFLIKVPIVPVMIFSLVILGCVALAYYLGGRKLFRCSLADALRDERIS